jgi:hypothetical protein
LKRFAGAIFSGSLVVGGLIGMSTPALAVTTFTTCANVTGHATLNPPISNGTATSSHVTGTGKASGCVGGGVTKGKITFQGDTVPGNCASFVAPTANEVVITGTQTIKWKNGDVVVGTSAGPLKAKSTATVGVVTVILKITSGKFAGTPSNPTKGKAKVGFTPDAGQDCFNTPISGVSVANSGGTCPAPPNPNQCTNLPFKSKF